MRRRVDTRDVQDIGVPVAEPVRKALWRFGSKVNADHRSAFVRGERAQLYAPRREKVFKHARSANGAALLE